MNNEDKLIEEAALLIQRSQGAYPSDVAKEIVQLVRDSERDGKNEAEFNIGKWLSAALDDPNVCAEMKLDIVDWFTFITPPKQPKE